MPAGLVPKQGYQLCQLRLYICMASLQRMLGPHGILEYTALLYDLCRKKDPRVEWLYSGPASSVNREEYLLGKKIDRQIDPTLAEDAREKEVCYCDGRRKRGIW